MGTNQSNGSRGIAGLLVLVLCSLLVVPASSYDFGELGDRTRSPERSRRNLTDEVRTLRSRVPESLEQFEVEPVGGTLVWVAVSGRKVHLSTGPDSDLIPGELARAVNGGIVTTDLYPIPATPSKALLSVVYRSYAGLTSVVFALTKDGDELALQQIDRQGGVALRPVGKFLHGQSFHASTFWSGPIHRYRSAEQGYRRAEPVNLPTENPRLLAATWLSEDRWALVDPSGNLRLLSSESVLDTVEGDFGATETTFTSERAMIRRPEKTERYRLPPAHLKEANVLALPRNPDPDGGLLDLFSSDSGEETALIRFFEHRDGRVARAATVGPLGGRIVDLHVSSANRSQLLWLRVGSDGTRRLEMIELE